MSCPLVFNDRAYVLGALTPEDRLQYEQHLQTCPVCAVAVGELAGLPGLLTRLPANQGATLVGDNLADASVAHAALDNAILDYSEPGPGTRGQDDPPVPQTLLLPQVRRERRRSLRRWALAVGAAAALAVVGTVAVEHLTSRGAPATVATRTVVLEPVGTSSPHGTAVLAARAWGSAIQVSCPADHDYGAGQSYTLYLIDRAGRRTASASWRALPDRDVTVVGATGLSPQEIVRLEVSDQNGTVVMRGLG